MTEKITTDLIRRTTRKPPRTTQDIYDTKQPGLVLRVRSNGTYSYRALLGRGRWHTLGGKDLTPDEARELAQGVRGDVSKARALGQDDPIEARRRRRQMLTFADFVEQHWAPWAREHLRSDDQTIESVQAILIPAFGTLRLNEITDFVVEKWRTKRLKNVTASTVNRNLDDLKAILNKAIDWKKVSTPMTVKRLKTDRARVIIRYLSPEEETRLLAALTARDTAHRAAREQANIWRRQRGYEDWPALGHYVDHLHPFVLLLLHTGLRRGEAFALTWADMDLKRAAVTIRGETAKSGQSRVIPLNATILQALTTWREQDPDADLIFANASTGESLTTIKTGWTAILKAAKIRSFRLHDCRHHFASRLVMAGVDLVTVSRLLGHADVRMTMRYSHLAPEHMAAAVAKLVSRGA